MLARLCQSAPRAALRAHRVARAAPPRREVRVEISEVKTGMKLDIDGKIMVVAKIEREEHGRRMTYFHLDLRDVQGKNKPMRIRSGERVERVELELRNFQVLFITGEIMTLMDPKTFEQSEVPVSLAGDLQPFLATLETVTLEYYRDTPVRLVPPKTVRGTVQSLKVGHFETHWQTATLTNGIKVDVPGIIKEGDVIDLRTDTMAFVAKA